MSIGTFVIGASVIFWAVVFAIVVAAALYLKRKGVFSRAASDAKSTLDQAATDAAQKVADKITGK